MKKLMLVKIVCLFVFFGFGTDYRRHIITISNTIENNSELAFVEHVGPPNSMQNALALNVEYGPIKHLREAISDKIGVRLDFLKAWRELGEAHVTVITPPEYRDILRRHLSMEQINLIAREMDIQSADLRVLGIARAAKDIQSQIEESYFIIVDSYKLREVRHRVRKAFVKNGGDEGAFDPTWFFPHITIGFTKRDLHESDGVLKDVAHSFDVRFRLQLSDD